MSNQVKEKITQEIQKAKQEGKLRTENIKEIVRGAIINAMAELKEGASEIREIVKEAIATVVENLQEKDSDLKEGIAASVQGAIEGLGEKKRLAIGRAKEEMQQLQAYIDRQERELDEEIDATLATVEESEKDHPNNLKLAIAGAVKAIRESEEVALMQKRYAQLQAQLAVLKANIEARHGDNYGEAKNYLVTKYLEDAKNWYKESQKWAQSDTEKSWLQNKQIEVESKIGEAGSALARQEKKVLQILKELWSSITESNSKTKEHTP
jgi:hypothetical protein